MLYSLHLMAATKVPELELDREEAKLLADSVTEVASHYNTVIDPKVIAWCGLIGVAGQIYGSRIVAIKARNKTVPRAQTAPAKMETASSFDAADFGAPIPGMNH